MKRFGAGLVGVAVGVATVLVGGTAWSCPEPTASFQLDGQLVPSTVAGAMYRNCESEVPNEDPAFSLVEVDTDHEIALSVTPQRHGLYEITFEEALDEDSTYEFTADPECPTVASSDAGSWTFDTGSAAEFPDDIGVWLPSSPVVGTVRHRGFQDEPCSLLTEAVYVELEFEPSAQAEVWGEALAFETYVNKEIWEPQMGAGETVPAGASRWGWGEEQIYSICDDSVEIEAQPHAQLLDRWVNIEIQAWFPGTERSWLSESEVVILVCPDEEEEGEEEVELPPEDDDDEEEDDDEELVIVDDDSSCTAVGGVGGGLISILMVLMGLGALREMK